MKTYPILVNQYETLSLSITKEKKMHINAINPVITNIVNDFLNY